MGGWVTRTPWRSETRSHSLVLTCCVLLCFSVSAQAHSMSFVTIINKCNSLSPICDELKDKCFSGLVLIRSDEKERRKRIHFCATTNNKDINNNKKKT